MHDNRELVEERIEKLRERVAERVYTVLDSLDVSAWQVPGEPVPFAEALGRSTNRSRSTPSGARPGPPGG